MVHMLHWVRDERVIRVVRLRSGKTSLKRSETTRYSRHLPKWMPILHPAKKKKKIKRPIQRRKEEEKADNYDEWTHQPQL